MNDMEYAYLGRVINKLTEIDISQYRSKQMRRRLDAFIASYRSQSIASYCRELSRDPQMLQTLRDFLTINVSEFFRDYTQFENLKKNILPELLTKRDRLNIWSAGCSIGAEPYSIAIILEELQSGQNHRILATDLDDAALKIAEAGGPYSPRDVENVSPYLLSKYFLNSNDQYLVGEYIRNKVRFRRHNLLIDPYQSGFDLIVCRNVVIYFTEDAKNTLNTKFRKALRPGGILFVGGSEIMMRAKEAGFESICPYFYKKPTDPIMSGV